MNIKLFIVVLTVLFLSGCASSQELVTSSLKKGKHFGVSVEAKPNQNTVKILSKPQGWNKSNKKDGYVGYYKGESGVTFFTLKKEDLGASCDNGADWVITRLQLATEGDVDEEKGSNFGQPQPSWLEEAFPGVDLADGDLFNVDKQDGRTFLLVFNANGQEGYKFIYYRLTLTRCSDGMTVSSDPGWGNGGRL